MLSISQLFFFSLVRLRRFVKKDKHSSDKSKLADIGEKPPGMCVIVEKEDSIDISKDIEDDQDLGI